MFIFIGGIHEGERYCGKVYSGRQIVLFSMCSFNQNRKGLEVKITKKAVKKKPKKNNRKIAAFYLMLEFI